MARDRERRRRRLFFHLMVIQGRNGDSDAGDGRR
jgi:hypothetical protein